MSSSIQVLYVDSDEEFAGRLADALGTHLEDTTVTVAHSVREGEAQFADADVDCIVSAAEFAEGDGLGFLQAVREVSPDLPFVLFPEQGSERLASDAISAGVTDYVRRADVDQQFRTLATRVEDAVSTYRARQETEQTKRLFQELTANSTDCLWIFDGDWEELLFISGYEQVWNRSSENLAAEPTDFLHGVHPEDRAFVRDVMDRLSAGESVDTEYRILRGDGETGWVWVKAEPVVDDSGAVVRIVGLTREVTERKAREQELRRSDARFEAMFEDPNILVGLLDTDGTVLDMNETALEYVDPDLSGIRGEPLWGTPWFAGDDQNQRAVRDYVDRAAEGEYVAFELDLSGAVEGELVVSGVFRPVVDEDGEITSVLASGRDVTEQRQHEQKLELRTQAIDEAPVGVVVTDPARPDNPIVYANDRFLELTGYDRSDVLGRNCRFLQGEETEEEPVSELRAAIDEERPVTVELQNYRKDGTMFWNRVSVAPVHDEEGELSNFVGFQETVTERKQRQQQLQVLDRILRHNIRNRITVIRSRAETVQSGPDPELATHAAHIVDACDDLASIAEKERLITQSLSEFQQVSVRLRPLLTQAASVVTEEYADASVGVDCPEDVTAVASPRIEDAFEELLTNAITHSDAATPEVSLTVTAETEVVHVDVDDTCQPIPEMERDILLGYEETPLSHGGGLGLWLVNLLVTQSGGTITISTDGQRGNTVRVTLPAETSDDSD